MIEPLSSGLVNSRDSSLLQAGELTRADDVFLKPSSPSIFRAMGSSKFNNTAVASSITGLTLASFDGAPDRVVAVAGGSYYSANIAETGSFSLLGTGAGPSVTSVLMNNRVALLSGSSNKVMLSAGTIRPMGLPPITATPSVQVLSPGNWPLTTTGWFEYWITEVYISADGKEEVEGTFEGTPKSVFIPNVTSKAVINQPPLSANATHWRVYRSDSKGTATGDEANVAFPFGFQIATIPRTTASFEDGGGAAGTYFLPTSYSGAIDDFDWDHPERLLLDDGSNATTFTVSEPNSASVYLYNFSITGVTDPITKITVRVDGNATGFISAQILLSWDAGTSWTAAGIVPMGTVIQNWDLTGLWGRTWSASEFSNANFRLRFKAVGIETGGIINADCVKVAIDSGGTTGNQTTPFPAIVITAGPSQGSIGANGFPPAADIGDSFQGSLVLNDVANPRVLRWTIPGTLDYSPSIYTMAMEWPITCIATLGSILIIGELGKVEALRYLPLEDDSEFNTGRARFDISNDDGPVNKRAYCRFTLAGKQYLFYVGYTHLLMTDGFSAINACPDIVWGDLISPNLLSSCFVVNNARFREIMVFFGTDMLRLSYDEAHTKDGRLKAAGIRRRGAACATSGINDFSERMVFTANGGTVYIENRGNLDAMGSPIVPRITTREMHASGLDNAWELRSLGIHHQGLTSLTASYTTTQVNGSDLTLQDHTLLNAVNRQLSIIDGTAAGEGIAINLTGVDDDHDMTLDYLMINELGLGEANALKI